MSDQAELIAKLSEAKAGSDELSARVMLAAAAPAGSYVEKSPYNGVRCIYSGTDNRGDPRLWDRRGLPHRPEGWPVTTSVDAALALIEKRLPGWSPSIVKALHEPVWTGEVVSPDLDDDDISEVGACSLAATPAVALCIALLKSLQAQQTAALKPEGGET